MTDIAQHLPKQSKTVEAIYAKYKELGDAEPARGYLGASIIGHPCERYLWYCFRQCCSPDISGRMYRLFETGDLEEARFVKNLRGIGCEVHDVDKVFEDKQFEVSAFGGHFFGHIDGCALGIPEAPKTWHVLEFKTHNNKSFNELKKKGVQIAKLQHYDQMQVYMHLTGMKRALYLARNKDTDELYSERIPYDKVGTEFLMERAERVITATSPPDRISDRRDFYQCGWCNAKSICHGTESPEPALPIQSLSCRQCCHATPVMEGEGGQWKCEIGKGYSLIDGGKPCEDHLILPGLIAFAEPTNGGDDFIEFTSHIGRTDFVGVHDGPKWRHGVGGYSSKELMEIPASMLSNEMIKSTKDLFGATITDYEMDILQRYPKGNSRTIWEGPAGELVTAWDTEYNEDLLSLTPITRNVGHDYSAVELRGGRVAIIYRETVTAEIREGVE